MPSWAILAKIGLQLLAIWNRIGDWWKRARAEKVGAIKERAKRNEDARKVDEAMDAELNRDVSDDDVDDSLRGGRF